MTEQEKTVCNSIKKIYGALETLREERLTILENVGSIPDFKERSLVIDANAHLEKAISELWSSMGNFALVSQSLKPYQEEETAETVNL